MELVKKLNLKTTGNTVDRNLILSVAKIITDAGKEVLRTAERKSIRFTDSLIICISKYSEVGNKDTKESNLPNPRDFVFETSFEEILTIVNDCASRVITGIQLKYLIIGGIMAAKGNVEKSSKLAKVNMKDILNVPDLVEVKLLRYDAGAGEMAVVIIDRELTLMFLKRGTYGSDDRVVSLGNNR